MSWHSGSNGRMSIRRILTEEPKNVIIKQTKQTNNVKVVSGGPSWPHAPHTTREESRAVARKPRNAAAVLFGLKFDRRQHSLQV